MRCQCFFQIRTCNYYYYVHRLLGGTNCENYSILMLLYPWYYHGTRHRGQSNRTVDYMYPLHCMAPYMDVHGPYGPCMYKITRDKTESRRQIMVPKTNRCVVRQIFLYSNIQTYSISVLRASITLRYPQYF